MRQCASDSLTFTMLAADQRGNLRRSIDPLAPTSVDDQTLVEFKLMVTNSLGPIATAVLLDPEYGAGQATATGALPGHVGLIVALEATGYAGDGRDRRNVELTGWSVEKGARLGASAVKLLLYYHPDAPGAADQLALLESVAVCCARHEMPLVVEPLGYSLSGPDGRLRGAEKAHMVVETARRITSVEGVDLLKAEFPGDTSTESAWSQACEDLTEASSAPWVLLSAGETFEIFRAQTEAACVGGASGVLAGRAVWAEAVGTPAETGRRFLEETARPRLEALRNIVESHGRPCPLGPAPQLRPGWYRTY